MTEHHASSSHATDLRRLARRVMAERGLLPDFSPAAMVETRSLAAASSVPAHGRDLRALPWASIDNDDSRDLDQLSVAQPLADGTVKILVAIADVDALVEQGSAIDAHARTNTTSVYTAAQVFPMLPEELSTDLTSLGENADRRAVVVEVDVRPDGSIAASEVYAALVRNRAKLAYSSVAAWLDGTSVAPARVLAVAEMDEQLRIQDRVAQQLRRRRFERGALALATAEARAVFDAGDLTDLVAEKGNRAKELIEDFMIAANTVVARFLEQRGAPSIRRVLRSPERWARIVLLAESLGEPLPAQPSNEALSAFLARRQEAAPSRFADLSLSVVKLLGRGEYVLELPGQRAPGHFGLAISDYAHSTAPNRRFPDLVVQRLLKAVLSGGTHPYSTEELAAIAAHCTEQEDNAAKVERRVRKSAAALLLSPRVGQRFDAFVTGASPKGTYVRIDHPAAEGRVVSGFEGLGVGDRTRVELVGTDFERGYVDFARVA
jgi:exoribonuclease-2